MVKQFQKNRENHERFTYIGEPADWGTYGKSAGPIRNTAMLEKHKPNFVIAFPGNRGTAHCMSEAERLGLQIVLPTWDRSVKQKRLMLMFVPKSRVDQR